MAHYLQGLIAAFAATASVAEAAPFSHKLHLKLVAECTSCHTSATTSTGPADNLLPGPGACRQCHPKPPPIKAPSRTLVTHFSHARHNALGPIAPVLAAAIDSKTYHSQPADAIRAQLRNARNNCTACHRGLSESDEVTKANLPRMADCLTCHPQIQNPFSCEKCHDPGPHLMPPSHVAGFMDMHSSPKAQFEKASCVICHGRRFTCLGCH